MPDTYNCASIIRLYRLKSTLYFKNYQLFFPAILFILLNKKSKKDLWFSQLAKGIFSELRCYGCE